MVWRLGITCSIKLLMRTSVFLQSEQKWKQLAELATSKCEFSLAQECLHQALDFGGLLLLASSAGNASMVNKLGETAEKAGQNNVAFLSYFVLGRFVVYHVRYRFWNLRQTFKSSESKESSCFKLELNWCYASAAVQWWLATYDPDFSSWSVVSS